MRKILLFGEDDAHERVLKALLRRLSQENDVPVEISVRSSIGGYGKAVSEFHALLEDALSDHESVPDLAVIATDSNCKGLNERLKAILDFVPDKMKEIVACAIPVPHIERWLLVDSAAFKVVFGRGCEAPDMKCLRDRYKQLLANAVRETGVRPLLGGLEYTDDIVASMDIDKAMRCDHSFARSIKELRRFFTTWKRQQ